jgi:hypothetical protein
MANYGPLDQVTDYGIAFTVWDFSTGEPSPYDFSVPGYAADALLSNPAWGQVQIFGVDQTGATISVLIGGVLTPLNGTGIAFASRAHANGLTCYFQYNMPNYQNQTYFFTAVFSIGASGGSQQSFSWQNNTLQ